MNISGIRPTAGFYSYNSIKADAVSRMQKVKEPDAQREEEAASEQEYSGEQQNFTAFDYAKNYRPEVNYQPNPKNVEVEQLDIDKIKSDLQKDQILQQYQYFVRGTDGVGNPQNSPKVMQRWKENFIL